MASATFKKPDSPHRSLFEELYVIAGVRNTESLEIAAKSPVKMIYLLFGNTLNIPEMVGLMRDCGKLTLVNIDLLSGFSRDPCNIEYLERCGAAGIVSTHQELIRTARNRGLITILRTFALDSAAVEACLRAIQNCQPDAVEVLPAVAAPRVAARLRHTYPGLRIIAGGLVANLKEVESLMADGIDAVSVSDPAFWVA